MVKYQFKTAIYKSKIRIHHKDHRRQLAQDAINATIEKNNIVISRATTVKEICATPNYNRSIEIPLCGTGKL